MADDRNLSNSEINTPPYLSSAAPDLIEQIYQELRIVARNQRHRHGASDTMNTTALVHEAYVKMTNISKNPVQAAITDRAHFFAIASRVIRDVIVDYARKQSAIKRGGRLKPAPLEMVLIGNIASDSVDTEEVLKVHEALIELSSFDAEGASVVELRYFSGLSIAEVAETLNLSVATVNRRWASARAWLFQNISDI